MVPARDSRGSRRDFHGLVFPKFHFGTALHKPVSKENDGEIIDDKRRRATDRVQEIFGVLIH